MNFRKLIFVIVILGLLITFLSFWIPRFTKDLMKVIDDYFMAMLSYNQKIESRQATTEKFADRDQAHGIVRASIVGLLKDLKSLVMDYGEIETELREFYIELADLVDYKAEKLSSYSYSALILDELDYPWEIFPKSDNLNFNGFKLEFLEGTVEANLSKLVVRNAKGEEKIFRIVPLKEAMEDGYKTILIFPNFEEDQPYKEFKNPRIYYLKKTFWGWKIDWRKSLDNLISEKKAE